MVGPQSREQGGRGKARKGEGEKGRKGEGERRAASRRAGRRPFAKRRPCIISHLRSFILHPSSFILHTSSFILHPSRVPCSADRPRAPHDALDRAAKGGDGRSGSFCRPRGIHGAPRRQQRRGQCRLLAGGAGQRGSRRAGPQSRRQGQAENGAGGSRDRARPALSAGPLAGRSSAGQPGRPRIFFSARIRRPVADGTKHVFAATTPAASPTCSVSSRS